MHGDPQSAIVGRASAAFRQRDWPLFMKGVKVFQGEHASSRTSSNSKY